MAWRNRKAATVADSIRKARLATVLMVLLAQAWIPGQVTARTNGLREPDPMPVAKSPACPQQVAAKYGIVAKLSRSGQQVHTTFTAHSVAALAINNVWIAGEATSTRATKGTANTWGSVSIIEHWDGRGWCVSENTLWPGAAFASIVATGPSDVWAVGAQPLGGIHAGQALIEHWNGREWALASPPPLGGVNVVFRSVAASSRTNVWAVGQSIPRVAGAATTQVLEHWDGHDWQLVPLGIPASRQKFISLAAVATRSNTDAWIVGQDSEQYASPFALQWDGHSWRTTALPRVTDPLRQERLNAVSALSAQDVWAVGSYEETRGGGGPLAYHWDGTAWHAVAVPNEPDAARYGLGGWPLAAVAAISSTDIWAMGTQGAARPLHWNGHGWHLIPPSAGAKLEAPSVESISAVTTSNIWAVGSYAVVADHWDGHRWGPISIAPTG